MSSGTPQNTKLGLQRLIKTHAHLTLESSCIQLIEEVTRVLDCNQQTLKLYHAAKGLLTFTRMSKRQMLGKLWSEDLRRSRSIRTSGRTARSSIHRTRSQKATRWDFSLYSYWSAQLLLHRSQSQVCLLRVHRSSKINTSCCFTADVATHTTHSTSLLGGASYL